MSIRSRPPATAPSAEPNPVMLLGTVQKATRGADYWSIIEGPAYSVDLHILGIVGAHHVLGPHVVVVADLPENHHPGDLHLQVGLRERGPVQGLLPIDVDGPQRRPAPRLRGILRAQAENAAPEHPPELGIERERVPAVGRGHEGGTPDAGLVVPAGQREPG